MRLIIHWHDGLNTRSFIARRTRDYYDPRPTKDDFDPNEPRDPSGKWTEGSGGGGGSKTETPKETKETPTSHLVYAPNREAWPKHIRGLVVPPAWTDTRISMDPTKPLQVIGKDAKGRLQYLYSAKFRDSQQAMKFKRVQQLDAKFDRLSQQVNKDLNSKDAKTQEHALVTKLIMDSGIRPGSEKATGGEKQAYGATTLMSGHVTSKDGETTLEFTGKKGVDLKIPVRSTAMANELKARAKKGGQLFPSVSDASLRKYVDGLGGGGFHPKDLRTLKATRISNDLVQAQKPPSNMTQYKKMVKEVAIKVSQQLGNTPTIALQSYINPAVFAPWQTFMTASEGKSNDSSSIDNDCDCVACQRMRA